MSASEPQQSNPAEATEALEDSADAAQPADFQELGQSQQPETTEAPKDVDLNVILDVDVTLGLEVGAYRAQRSRAIATQSGFGCGTGSSRWRTARCAG